MRTGRIKQKRFTEISIPRTSYEGKYIRFCRITHKLSTVRHLEISWSTFAIKSSPMLRGCGIVKEILSKQIVSHSLHSPSSVTRPYLEPVIERAVRRAKRKLFIQECVRERGTYLEAPLQRLTLRRLRRFSPSL